MTVFIAHAKADAAAAESLKKVLDMRGLFSELETGERGFRHLGAMDAVVALWSKNSPFDLHRLQFEKRALDAWADGRLILVKLDPHFAPVGLRDLPFVDAIFEQQRDLVAWPEVAKRARDATRPAPPPAAAAPAPQPGAIGRAGEADEDGFGGAGASAPASKQRAKKSARGRAERGARPRPRVKEGPGVLARIFAALLIGVGAAAIATAVAMNVADTSGRTAANLGIAVGAAFAILVLLIGFLGGRRPEKTAAGDPALDSMDDLLAAEEGGAELAAPPSAVFVSYSRADASFVLPVCDALKSQGKELWLDQEGIDAGESWAGEIVRAIRTVRGVAVMCSKAAFESDHVKREVYLADRYKKRLLPVLIDDTPMPDDFEYFFAGVQWLELHKTPEKDRPAAMARALAL